MHVISIQYFSTEINLIILKIANRRPAAEYNMDPMLYKRRDKQFQAKKREQTVKNEISLPFLVCYNEISTIGIENSNCRGEMRYENVIQHIGVPLQINN